jgi:hypothetical protein
MRSKYSGIMSGGGGEGVGFSDRSTDPYVAVGSGCLVRYCVGAYESLILLFTQCQLQNIQSFVNNYS